MKEWFRELRCRLAYLIAPEMIDDYEEKLSGLLCHVTGGLLSYTHYDLKTMMCYADSYCQSVCDKCEYYLAAERDGEA